MYTGFTLIGVGAITAIVGAIIVGAARPVDCFDCPAFDTVLAGYLMIPTGVLTTLAGVLTWAISARRVPVKPEAALGPTLTIGPTGGSLSWSF